MTFPPKQIDRNMSFYYTTNEQLQGMLAVYAEDALATGNTTFKTLADEITLTFESQHR